MIQSPCRNVCRIDARSGLCVGCGRSLSEVSRWMQLTDGERRRVMQQLPARLAQLPVDVRAP